MSVCVQEEVRINLNKIESASLMVQSNFQSKPHRNKKNFKLRKKQGNVNDVKVEYIGDVHLKLEFGFIVRLTNIVFSFLPFVSII